MQTYWLEFTDGTFGACEGQSPYDAKIIAEKITGKKVKGGDFKDIAAKTLPYPTSPMIWQHDHPVVEKCPPFCYTPSECAGRTACPKRRACDD